MIFLDNTYFKKQILTKKKKRIAAWGPKQKKEMEIARDKEFELEKKSLEELNKKIKKIPNQLGYFYITLK